MEQAEQPTNGVELVVNVFSEVVDTDKFFFGQTVSVLSAEREHGCESTT